MAGFSRSARQSLTAQELDFGKGEEVRESGQGAIADTDGAEDNAIARGDGAVQAEHGAGHDERQGGGGSGALQELAAA